MGMAYTRECRWPPRACRPGSVAAPRHPPRCGAGCPRGRPAQGTAHPFRAGADKWSVRRRLRYPPDPQTAADALRRCGKRGVGRARRERSGKGPCGAVDPALAAAHEHRSLTVRAAAGDGGAAPGAEAAAGSWKAALDKLDEVDQRLGGALATGSRMRDLRRTMQAAVVAGTKRGTAAHDEAIAALLAAGAAVGDSSNLVLDPDLDAFYLRAPTVRRRASAAPPRAMPISPIRSGRRPGWRSSVRRWTRSTRW
jgi:hypothetical protein